MSRDQEPSLKNSRPDYEEQYSQNITGSRAFNNDGEGKQLKQLGAKHSFLRDSCLLCPYATTCLYRRHELTTQLHQLNSQVSLIITECFDTVSSVTGKASVLLQ